MHKRFPGLFLMVAWALGGCAASATRRAEAYQQLANERFADADVRERLAQRFAVKYPEFTDTIRAAMMAQKKIVGVKFLGAANFGYPKEPPMPLEKLWVSILITRQGSASLSECLADGDRPAKPEQEILVRKTVAGWKFSPLTIDGEPVDSPNYFPVLTDGVKIYISSPKVF